MLRFKILFLLLLLTLTDGKHGFTNLGQLRDGLHELMNSDDFKMYWEPHWKDWQRSQDDYVDNDEIYGSKPLECSSMSPTHPTSVHKLRPQDIEVVAALGDSLTAANGAGGQRLIDVLFEYRGISWTMGGDGDLQNMVTLPNIFSQFNPKLIGASHKVGPVWFKHWSQLNVAVPGAVAEDLPDQAWELVRRLQDTEEVDHELDWKFISIFIGANDICNYCNNKNKTASYYVNNIKKALDILQQNLPRTFVNLINILHVENLRKTHQNSFCYLTHSYECPCILEKNAKKEKLNVSQLVKQYQEAVRKLIDSGRYNTKEDFTVVIQQLLERAKMPIIEGSTKPDLMFLAPDCFHWSQLGHSIVARGVWNSLFEPVGDKSRDFDAEKNIEHPEALKCPPEHCPFLRTLENSRDCSKFLSEHSEIANEVTAEDNIVQAADDAEDNGVGEDEKVSSDTSDTDSMDDGSQPIVDQPNVKLAAIQSQVVDGSSVEPTHHITASIIAGTLIGIVMFALIASVIYRQRCRPRQSSMDLAVVASTSSGQISMQKPFTEKTPLLDADLHQVL